MSRSTSTTTTISTHSKHHPRWYAVVPHLNEWQRFFLEKGLPDSLKVEEVALFFKVHVETVRQWDKDGLLKAERTGPKRGAYRDRRFPKKEILRVFKEGLFGKQP